MKKLLIALIIMLTLVSFVSAQLDNTTPDEETNVSDAPIPPETSVLSTLKSNSRIILGGVIALIILIIIVKVAKRSPKPEKLYRKAESVHREAEEFHNDGDEETAQELYEKAEEIREKAREMESKGV